MLPDAFNVFRPIAAKTYGSKSICIFVFVDDMKIHIALVNLRMLKHIENFSFAMNLLLLLALREESLGYFELYLEQSL